MHVFNVYSNSRLIHAGVPLEGRILIGRDATCDLVVSDPSVSRRHLSLELTPLGERELIVLRDLASRNGVLVNSQRVEERAVTVGDLICFGACRLELVRQEASLADMFFDPESDTVSIDWKLVGETGDGVRLQALYSMALALAELEIPFMLEKAAEIVRTVIEFEEFGFLLQGSTGVVLCTSWNAKGPCRRDEIEPPHAVIKDCLRRGQPHVVSPAEAGEAPEVLTSAAGGIVACIPMQAGLRSVGALYCRASEGKTLSNVDVQFLTLVACFVGSGIVRRRSLGELQKTTSRLETILGCLQEGVIVCDSDFRVLSANHSAREVCDEKAVVGRPLGELLGGFAHSFDPVVSVQNRYFDLERRRDSTEGPPKLEVFHATLSRTKGLDSAGYSYVICVRNVTREREKELFQLSFVNRLAHKLRGPLTVLTSTFDLLSEAPLMDDVQREETKAMAARNCHQLASLVDRFVDFSSMSGPESQVGTCAVPVALRFLVEEAIRLSHEAIAEAGLEILNLTTECELEVTVLSDQMTRVFQELILNACRYAGAGCRLTIECSLDHDLRMRFHDNGQGIDREQLPRVLDLFEQLDPDKSGEAPGVGLGLWWVRAVLRFHRGDIRLARTPGGQGLEVDLVLPLEFVQEVQPAAIEAR